MESPREKYLKYNDPRKLTTEDLVAILISHGSSKLDVYELSDLITSYLRSKQDRDLNLEELLQFDGIGQIKAMQIIASLELGRRFFFSSLPQKLSELDWDFADLKQSERQYGVHFFHHYTAKFIPQIPARLIKQFVKPGAVVLDPFMGSGTTLIESKLLGCHSFGLDTNPMAVKIANAKTLTIDDIKITEINNFLEWLEKKKIHSDDNTKVSDIYELFEGSKLWFRPDVTHKIKCILDEIESYSPEVKNFLEVGLSTILKGISNARMDSVTPVLPEKPIYIDRKHYYREVNNLTRNIPVYQRLFSHIRRMRLAILEFNKETAHNLDCVPILADAKDLTNYVTHCDLVVTSPPYWSAQNYEKIHMLPMQLLNLKIKKGKEIGRDRSTYLRDMKEVFLQIAKILNGNFALIIGHDDQRFTHEKLLNITIEVGFNHIDTIIRRISNQASRAKQIKCEYIYIFKI